MINKKAVFINTASQIIVRIITLAFTLVSIKLLSNYIGVDGVGKYNTITTYVNLFIVLADLGLFAVTVREIAKTPENEKKIVSNAFFIRLVSALLACVLAISILLFTKYRFDKDIFYGTVLASGFIFFNLLGSIYDMILQYRLKMQYSALAELLGKLISIIALYLVVRANGNFLWVASTIAIYGLFLFLFKWLFGRSFLKFGIHLDKNTATWIFKLAWPLGIVFILNNLFFKLDTLMLYAIKGAGAVGIYSVAYKVLEVTVFFGSYFASALKPALAQKIDHDKEAVARIINKSITAMFFIGAPIAFSTLLFPQEIIVFLSNPDFVSGAPALVLLSLTLPLIYLVVLLSEILVAADKRKLLVQISVSMLIFNFLFNLIFIPKLSFMGAAWGTFVSEVVLLCAISIVTKKIVPFTINWITISKVLLALAGSILLILPLRNISIHFIILIAIFFIVYAIMSLLLRITSVQSFKELVAKNDA